jgi:hypothetical protein
MKREKSHSKDVDECTGYGIWYRYLARLGVWLTNPDMKNVS